MLLKKVDQRYYISGGLTWIPLPESINSRSEIDKYYNQYYFKNSGDGLSYATEDHKKARFYEVTFWENKITNTIMPRIFEDESKSFIMGQSYPTNEEISTYLKERAKAEGLEAVIHFKEPRPEPEDK